jgi:hypothetical protein
VFACLETGSSTNDERRNRDDEQESRIAMRQEMGQI